MHSLCFVKGYLIPFVPLCPENFYFKRIRLGHACKRVSQHLSGVRCEYGTPNEVSLPS